MAKTVLVRDTEADPQQAFVVAPSDFYAQNTDPGAVGAGSVWKDTTVAPYLWWERNDANDGWNARVGVTVVAEGADEAYAATTANSVDGGAEAGLIAAASGSGDASAAVSAETADGAAIATQRAVSADGATTAGALANATGTGTADTTATSTTVTGNATSGIKADRGGTVASVLVDSTDTNARVRAVASDITLTATDDITLTTDGDVSVTPAGTLIVDGGTLVDIGSGNVRLNIPTTDPGGGKLWCDPADGFTVKVSQT